MQLQRKILYTRLSKANRNRPDADRSMYGRSWCRWSNTKVESHIVIGVDTSFFKD